MNWWSRPSEWNDTAAAPAGAALSSQRARYFAFLSYSHKDEALATWLHSALERFRVPASIAGTLTDNGVVPKRLSPIFRDRHELAAAQDLGEEICEALAASRFLIVLCSPAAAKSKWTNAEIDKFKRSRPDGCVIAAIVDGEPFASDLPGREEEECFPPALRLRYDRRGRPTAKRAEPLAADLREERDGRRTGLLKIVAGMLGVGLDELVQRDQMRRQRRLARITATSLAGMIAASVLAVTAISARDSARDQRREAESLVQFMLGDLKDKLEPIGRLDALDGVGSRVLAYYSKQDTSDLSDSGLLQRSRALSLMAEVAHLRGDLGTAERLYREAAEGTREAVSRDPADPQRLFDHAQNVYYVGYLAAEDGQLSRAEAAFREYKRLADRMIAIAPDNLKWRMEVQYAEANLGIVLLKQRRFAEAATQFAGALKTIEAVAAIDGTNADYQKSVAESLAWLADAQLAQGKLKDAIVHRRRQLALLERLAQEGNGDVEYRQKLIPARQTLGRLLALTGDVGSGVAELKRSVSEAEALIPIEPNNTKWLDYAASAKLDLATVLLSSRTMAEATAQTQSGCAIVERLLRRDAKVVKWRTLLRKCLLTRAQVSAAAGSPTQALAPAHRALEVSRSVNSSDRVADSFAVAKAYRVIGDIHARAGNSRAAKAAWLAGFDALPRTDKEMPEESADRLTLLHRLGRADEARQLGQRLASIGLRHEIQTI